MGLQRLWPWANAAMRAQVRSEMRPKQEKGEWRDDRRTTDDNRTSVFSPSVKYRLEAHFSILACLHERINGRGHDHERRQVCPNAVKCV